MIKLIEQWGMIAGIGGIAFGALVILFRELIKKKIFPKLSQKNAFTLLLVMVIMIFTTAVYGLYIYHDISTKKTMASEIRKEVNIISEDLVNKISKADAIQNIEVGDLENALTTSEEKIADIKKYKYYSQLSNEMKANIQQAEESIRKIKDTETMISKAQVVENAGKLSSPEIKSIILETVKDQESNRIEVFDRKINSRIESNLHVITPAHINATVQHIEPQ